MQRKSGKELLADWKKSGLPVEAEIKIFMKEAFFKRLAKFDLKNHLTINDTCISAPKGKKDFDIFFNVASNEFLTPIHYIRVITSENKIDDGVKFEIDDAKTICSENDYKIVRVWLNCSYDNIVSTLILDCFIGLTLKIISSESIDGYFIANLEFPVAANLERILLSKIEDEKINDFYYNYYIMKVCKNHISLVLVKAALDALSEKHHTNFLNSNKSYILDELENSKIMYQKWLNFQAQHKFAEMVSWHEVMKSLKLLYSYCLKDYEELDKIDCI